MEITLLAVLTPVPASLPKAVLKAPLVLARKCKDSDCRIVVAASIGKKCSVTIRCIIFAIDIITERFQASCCVHIPGRVAKERLYAGGGVTEAGNIAAERE
jgi:hypothetical protein